MLNVSRQAITKWENDGGMPDISNLKKVAETFGVTVDFLLKDDEFPSLLMRKELKKEDYNKMYDEVLKKYLPIPFEVYVLIRSKKQNIFELALDTFTVPEIGPIATADDLSDMSPYYLVTDGKVKLLVNIKKYILLVYELPEDTNTKRFTYG